MKIRLGELRRLIREELQVVASVRQSHLRGAGKGLFADEDIAKGTKVFAWNPQVDSEYSAEYPDGLPTEESEEFKELASWDGDVWFLAGDGGAYFNHADEPNVAVLGQHGKPAKRDRFAIKDIRKGDELTMDYSQIGIDVPGDGL